MNYLEFIYIFILSFVFIKFLKQNASYFGLVDIPNERSMHKRKTPNGGGIGFVLSVYILLLCFSFDFFISNILTFIAIILVFTIGVLDDHRDASPNTKFFVIIASAICLSFDDIIITDLGLFFGYQLSLGWFALPFTVFAVVGFTNALNLIDGLDGLSTMISLIIFFTFFLLGYQYNDLFLIIISGAFISTLLAFILFNWHPATIFMGDSGSLTVGFVISILAIKSLEYLPAISIFFVAAIPILDTLIVMIRRKRNGKSMFTADKCHFHHILKKFFSGNTPKTTLFISVLQAIYSFVGFNLDREIDGGYLLILFIMTLLLFYILLETMIQKQNRKC